MKLDRGWAGVLAVVLCVGGGASAMGSDDPPGGKRRSATAMAVEYDIVMIIDGVVAFVPRSKQAADTFSEVWALLPNAWDDTINDHVEQAGFQPPFGMLPLHHPVLRIPGKSIGKAEEIVRLYLNSSDPLKPYGQGGTSEASYDISIEPLDGSSAATSTVSFEGRQALPLVYRKPPQDGMPGEAALLDPEALKAKPAAYLPLAARIKFSHGEQLKTAPIVTASMAYESRVGCSVVSGSQNYQTVYQCASTQSVPSADGLGSRVLVTRRVSGAMQLILTDLQNGNQHRFPITEGMPLALTIANVTAEDLQGLPVRHAHRPDGTIAIDHFVLLYGLASPKTTKVVGPFWYPVATPGVALGIMNTRPFCSAPGRFADQ